jgi:hypothetical protein
MLEKTLESKITKKAKELGFLTYKFSSPSNRGVPDRMFISPTGNVFFIEFKTMKGILSALQKKIHAEIENKGIKVYVIRNIESGLEVLRIKACEDYQNYGIIN